MYHIFPTEIKVNKRLSKDKQQYMKTQMNLNGGQHVRSKDKAKHYSCISIFSTDTYVSHGLGYLHTKPVTEQLEYNKTAVGITKTLLLMKSQLFPW